MVRNAFRLLLGMVLAIVLCMLVVVVVHIVAVGGLVAFDRYGGEPSNVSSEIEVSERSLVAEMAVNSYRVRDGDTLYSIARCYDGVSHVDIMRSNGISASGVITPGQLLKIPNNP